MIFVDSNVFVIDLRYPRDSAYAVNARFLRRLSEHGDGATTLVNVLEVAGILSHNLNAQQAIELITHFSQRYSVKVYPEPAGDTTLWPCTRLTELKRLISRRMSFGDALVLSQVEQYATSASTFVSWDFKHFTGKTDLTVMSPRSFLDS